jgi:pyridoxal phosphate enzyme (YggS family)
MNGNLTTATTTHGAIGPSAAPLSAERIRANLREVRAEIDRAGARAGRWPISDRSGEVRVLAATKYVPLAELPLLAQAGIKLVGENRAQDLQAKAQAHGELFEWDFIGRLQSRKVRSVIPLVRLIHSVASESVLRELARHRELAPPDLAVLIEVNVAGEAGKEGIVPEQLGAYIERCPMPVVGLMTMPPPTPDPECSRRWFAALRELAETHGLSQLSMGTTQDFPVAVEEGATIVRIGTRLYA